MATCPLCGNTATQEPLWGADGAPRAASLVTCKALCGGTYEITDEVASDRSLSTEHRRLLAGAVRHAALRQETLKLDGTTVPRILSSVPRLSLVGQADLLLEYLEARLRASREPVRLDPNKDYSVVYGTHPDDLKKITQDFGNRGFIERAGPSAELYYLLTPAGSERLEQRHQEKRASWGLTGWERVDRTLDRIREAAGKAKTEEELVAVGAMCRDALVSLGENAWDPARHPIADRVEPPPNDFQRRLDAVIAAQLTGKESQRMRKLVKDAEALAHEVTHGRSLKRERALLCAHTVAFLAVAVAIVVGKRQ